MALSAPMAKERFDAFEPIDTPEEVRWLTRVLKDETFGGALLLFAALAALIVANSPAGDFYKDLLDTKIGIETIGLKLTLAHWAADGLLAIFFLVAGLELKHEFTHGSLANPKQALVPIVAAIAGMVFPAIVFVLAVNGDREALAGWAIPVATDIAFALAVLAVAGRGLPVELRAFLLTLAVVDDLGAITIIAFFYSDKIKPNYLLLTIALIALYALLQKLRYTRWFYLLPLGLTIWWATYQSGIHATVAGVAIALLTNVKSEKGKPSPAEIAELKARPISVAFAVPLYAFSAAGVDLRELGAEAIISQISLAVILGLVIGKPAGVMLATYLLTKFTSAKLNENLRWPDVFAVCLLAGIGFTVSLLITELSYDGGSNALAEGKIGVLTGSLLSALAAVVLLKLRRNKL